MRLVVTGATGFIGARLIDRALSRGYEVTALARDPERIATRTGSGLRVERWTIGEPLPPLGHSEAVLHLAAYIPADLSDAREAARCFEINTNGAIQAAMEAASQGVKRFVQFGSAQVYAHGTGPASETSPAFPVHRASYYLASKLAAEICLLHFGKSSAMPVTVLRLASVYGPGMHDTGMVPTFVRTLGSGRSLVIQDGGRYSVDLVYVDDVVTLALKAADRAEGGVFNAGSGRACTSLEAAQIIADAVGAERHLIAVEGGSVDAPPPGFRALDVSKAGKELNYAPSAFRQGIEAWRSLTGLTDFQLRVNT